ncbi:GNAT family N-acetyltransferase [Bradyrhizobium sp. 180]|uniref:GNAT family N-acetyltransferase n=1 Tax=unclassified Bradyrhizobium TaxID=2631580 RepID=UPI001FFB80BB|nr:MULTISPECIES: GNAT family N-acetyltransferase [unclassified Bradyrhizobium]MCK1493771.1 GNAT family N-acetyltransferase [Bradyrhizobium sp. 180]MCK1667761.1 GNAT family N-acetyltransferase [Bradyrhizobium sp. 153]
MIQLVNYDPQYRESWNALNAQAKNGHFFFDRNFMEYHSDRFHDASCLFLYEQTPIALLPANFSGDTLYSHQGLTFGGLVLDQRATSVRVLSMWQLLLADLRDRGIKRLVYKPLPLIYHRSPAQEDLYALFRHDAKLVRRDVTTTIDYGAPGPQSKRRQRGVKKAAKAKITFAESRDWQAYWTVLSEALSVKHAVAPTHTAEEIAYLAERFPNAIRLFTAQSGDAILAGVVMFETARVAHAQYIAASPEGRDVGALDGLFNVLIERYRSSSRFFDFGISNEDNGRVLNEGLVTQKEEFGGSTAVHDVYEIALHSTAV